MTLGNRFWSKVDKNGPIPEYRPDLGPCWLWTAARDERDYGRYWLEGTMKFPHVLAWEEENGPTPDGLIHDHLCRVHPCLRPSHVESVTQQENLARSAETLASRNGAKTHCPKNHPYSEENTYVHRRGDRQCRSCMRERVRARRAVA